jgi:aspartate/methionine/tyrosine aminotransferase
MKVWLGYTQTEGDPLLRDQIATLYSEVEPDVILVHAGAEEPIFNRLVVINCPHNPTGYLMPPDEFDELANLSRKHGFIIFSDEVYRLLEYEHDDRLPAICEIDDRGASLGVMSKTFGLAGLRIGWIATRNKKLLKNLAARKDYTTICNSAPSEFLATLALKHKYALIQRNLKIIKKNLTILDRLNQFRSGKHDLYKYMKAVCDEIESKEPRIQAFVTGTFDRDRILETANELAAKYPHSPDRPAVFGLPIGVKDIFRVHGFPTRCGSRLPASLFEGVAAS